MTQNGNKVYDEIITDLTAELGYDFRINDLNEKMEVKIEGQWERMSDTLKAVINTNLRGLKYGTKKKPNFTAVEQAYITLAHHQRYHPFKEYFESLAGKYEPDRDGQPYVNQLFGIFFENPDKMFCRWLFKWMTGTIAKVYEGARNPMLVLVGEQRMGKSYLARWLCPVDPDKYFVEKPINPDKTDDKLLMIDKLIWELPELGAVTRRADVESLKAVLTMRRTDERRAYGQYNLNKPSVCSFIGSVNFDGAGFLNDPTGSTRFLACQIDSIDFKYTVQPVSQLWAEAYWFYRHVSKCWELTAEEQVRQAEINASFEIVSALEETIINQFEITHNPQDFLTTQDIKNHLVGKYQTGNESGFFRELSRLMHKMGVEKGREKYDASKSHLRGWIGIKRREV